MTMLLNISKVVRCYGEITNQLSPTHPGGKITAAVATILRVIILLPYYAGRTRSLSVALVRRPMWYAPHILLVAWFTEMGLWLLVGALLAGKIAGTAIEWIDRSRSLGLLDYSTATMITQQRSDQL